MAEKWYPVVDFIVCIECGDCANSCPESVYDISKSHTPVVRNPINCIDHCHKCGDICPVAAIAYVGEDTGWIPAILKEKGGIPDVLPNTNSCCCCGGQFNG